MHECNLLFRCPHCRWWAAGRHHSEKPLSFENLDDAMFDVTCTSKECGWSGKLPGSEGIKKPTSYLSRKAGA